MAAQNQENEKNFKMNSEISDILCLVDLVEKSLNCIESSTISLENLRNGFETLFDLFKKLEQKIDCLDTLFLQKSNEEMHVYVKVIFLKIFFYY